MTIACVYKYIFIINDVAARCIKTNALASMQIVTSMHYDIDSMNSRLCFD